MYSLLALPWLRGEAARALACTYTHASAVCKTRNGSCYTRGVGEMWEEEKKWGRRGAEGIADVSLNFNKGVMDLFIFLYRWIERLPWTSN